MNIKLAIILACLVSFISISMEILWVSVISYILQGHAGIFALVLSSVLFGIAFGAKFAIKKSSLESEKVVDIISNLLLTAGIVNFVGFPVIGWLVSIHAAFGILLFALTIGVSFLFGSIFPFLCQISIASSEKSVGQYMSWIYAGNIIGATTGPLITGFILIDNFTMESIVTVLCLTSVILSMAIKLNFKTGFKWNLKKTATNIAFIILILVTFRPLYSNYLEQFHFKGDYNEESKFKHIVQNKSGIITVIEDKEKGDKVYGGGAYDGRMNINPENNANGIDRTFMVAALHPNPKKVLMIGLSTGSWAKILSDFSKIEKLTVIEINPKYIEIIKKYPDNATILSDSKVEIVIDDGRRWLNHNKDEKFDFIVMNTTYHWREQSTNLLSDEFLKTCKESLNDGGVVYWNTTGLQDIIFTAAHNYNHVTTFGNFVAASDAPFNMSYEDKKLAFSQFIRDGKPVFEKNENTRNILENFANAPLIDVQKSVLEKDLWLITDDNMASEYKAGLLKSLNDLKKIIKEKQW